MTGWTRTKAGSVVRTSRLAQTAVALSIIILLGAVLFFIKAKTITIDVDGETTRITTIYNTVGEALKHSKLTIYPEDIIIPTRDTAVTRGLQIEVIPSTPINLVVDGKTIQARTPEKTVEGAITDLSKRYNLNIKDIDEVNVPRSDEITANIELKVSRAIPIHVQADGKKWDTYLAPRTVAEAIDKLNLNVGKNDKLSLAMDHVLQPDDNLKIVRVTEKVETIKSEIPYQVIAQPADFPVGLPDRVIDGGKNGSQAQTVKITYEDGKEVDREIQSQRVLKAPVARVVSRGTATSVSRGGRTVKFKRAYLMKATAYSEPGGVTATGEPVHWGVVAVDPDIIPLGAKVYVEGYGEAVALDTGGAINGKRIDLYMDTEQAALSWGVRNVVVYVE